MPPHSQSKVQSSTTVKEETIDIDVSETSEDKDTPPAPANAQVVPTDSNETHIAPIIKPVVKSNRALDIDLLFDCGKGKPSVCKYCR